MTTSSGKLVGESRNLQKKLAAFFCVTLRTGEVLWEDARFGEPWWIGIEAVYNDTLLLHKFETPELPEHRSVIAVDVLTGSELWRNEDVTFELLRNEAVSVTRTQPLGVEHLDLDYRTGEVVARGGVEGDEGNLKVQDAAAFDAPAPVYDFTRDDVPASIILQHCDPEKVVMPVDCLELDTKVVCNYHERIPSRTDERPCMKSILFVADKSSGALLFRDIINKESWSVVPEAFFVSQNMLVYIRERTMLTAVDLGQA